MLSEILRYTGATGWCFYTQTVVFINNVLKEGGNAWKQTFVKYVTFSHVILKDT